MSNLATTIDDLEKIVEFAIDYAHRGWHVFPCSPRDKKPLTPNGFYDATRNENQIRAWWRKWPDAIIGVRMGGLSGVWALDPDAPKKPGDPDGRAKWQSLIEKHGAIHTHTHNTPGGGQHLLFKWDADRPVTNKEGHLKGLGINVRGEGGYIIAPPSARYDGNKYEVADPLDFFHFATAPDWLYDLIDPPRHSEQKAPSISERARAQLRPPTSHSNGSHRAYVEAALRNEIEQLASTPAGERNNALNAAAFKLGTLVGAGALRRTKSARSPPRSGSSKRSAEGRRKARGRSYD